MSTQGSNNLTYFFNELYDGQIIDQSIYDLKSELYQRALEAQVAIHNPQVLYGTMSDFKVDDYINEQYNLPVGTYTHLIQKDIVPYFNKKRFIDNYSYDVPISLLDIINDYKTFSRRIVFTIDKYMFLMLRVVSMHEGTLLAIYSDSVNGIGQDTINTFISGNSQWTLTLEDQSDFYYSYRIKTNLFTANTNNISINQIDTKLEFDKEGKSNSYNIAISASPTELNLLAQSTVTVGVEADNVTKCFVTSVMYKNYIFTNSNNCKCFIFNNYIKTGYTNLGCISNLYSAPISANWRALCYGDGKFVSLSLGYTYTMYSTDGITWTQGGNAPVSAKWYSVCYGNGKFVAIAADTNVTMYSTDGITWTQGGNAPVSAIWVSVCYGNGKFVATAEGTNVTMYSTDGITWIQGGNAPVNLAWESVCYGNGKFVAISYNNNVTMYSTDGITWTQGGNAPVSAKWYSVCYGNGKFVAIAADTNVTMYSTDGVTWTQGGNAPVSAKWYSVCYGNGKFVAISYSNNVTMYSSDGITWTQGGNAPISAGWRSVCYGNGKFVVTAMGSKGINVFTLTDSKFQIPYDKNPIPSQNINIWEYDNINDIKLTKKNIIPTQSYPNIYDASSLLLNTAYYVEWYSPIIKPIQFDNNVEDYLKTHQSDFLQLILNNATPEVLSKYLPMMDFVYDYSDYQQHQVDGDLRGYKLYKLKQLLADNPIRHHEIMKKIRAKKRNSITWSYDMSIDTGIYNRTVTNNSGQITNTDDLITFSEPHVYVEVSNSMDKNYNALVSVDGKRIPVTVCTENHKSYVYIPKSKLTAQSIIVMDIPLVGASGTTKYNGAFMLSTLNTYVPFPNPIEFGKVSTRDLVFYDKDTLKYYDPGLFKFGVNVNTAIIKNDREEVRLQYTSDEISYLESLMNDLFLTSAEEKIILAADTTLIESPYVTNKKLNAADMMISSENIALLNRNIGVSNANNYRWAMIPDIANNPTGMIPNFKEDPSPERFRVFVNGLLVESSAYTYTPPALYGDNATFTIISYNPIVGTNSAIVEYIPYKERTLISNQSIPTDKLIFKSSTCPVNTNWLSLCYGNGKFVAISYNNNVTMYSTDGITWTQGGNAPVNTGWYSVCYGNGKFVAIAYNSNATMYSTDGITWTQGGNSPVSALWDSVCYGNGKFVAISTNNNATMYSTDGITWTRGGNAPVSAYWQSVCYGNGRFVAIVNGTSTMYSTDGITWTQGGNAPVSANWISLCYGNGRFVSVTDGNVIMYSTDGITWTRGGNAPISSVWMSVCYGNGKFVAVAGYSDTTNTMYSTDGITWTQGGNAPVSAKWRSVCYGNGKFVAISQNANTACYSVSDHPLLYTDNLLDLSPLTLNPFDKNTAKVYLNGERISPKSIKEVKGNDLILLNTAVSNKTLRIDVPIEDSDCYGFIENKSKLLANDLLSIDTTLRDYIKTHY